MSTSEVFTRFFRVGLRDTVSKSRFKPRAGREALVVLEPAIIEQFPESGLVPLDDGEEEVLQSVPNFCFNEDNLYILPDESEFFTFVLTNLAGERMYGYCRRRLPLPIGNQQPWHECICIISKQLWPSTFNDILLAAESLFSLNQTLILPFFQSIYYHSRLLPGDVFTVHLDDAISKIRDLPKDVNIQRKFTFLRPSDLRAMAGNADFSVLFSSFDATSIVRLFCSMIWERKIIFTSKSNFKITSSILSLVSLLYPFAWEHVLITILPKQLLEVATSPVPYLLGVHQSHIEKVRKIVEETVVVDIDEGSIRGFPKDVSLLPDILLKQLTTSLQPLITPRETKGPPEKRGQIKKLDAFGNATIGKAFVHVFSKVFETMHDFFDQNGKFVFANFKAKQPKHLHQFLDVISQTQMFMRHIHALEHPDPEEELETKPAAKKLPPGAALNNSKLLLKPNTSKDAEEAVDWSDFTSTESASVSNDTATSSPTSDSQSAAAAASASSSVGKESKEMRNAADALVKLSLEPSKTDEDPSWAAFLDSQAAKQGTKAKQSAIRFDTFELASQTENVPISGFAPTGSSSVSAANSRSPSPFLPPPSADRKPPVVKLNVPEHVRIGEPLGTDASPSGSFGNFVSWNSEDQQQQADQQQQKKQPKTKSEILDLYKKQPSK